MTHECLHLVFNTVMHDSRVLKEISSLVDSGVVEKITVVGRNDPGFPERSAVHGQEVSRISLHTRGLPKTLPFQAVKYAELCSRIVRRYRKSALRVIHCHDLAPLPVAVRLKKLTGARVIYDSHELQTETTQSTGFRKKMRQWVEERYIREADAMITVSPSIRAWYLQRYPGVPVHMVRNIPNVGNAGLAPVSLRQDLGVPEDALLFLYLGGLSVGRGIEKTLAAFRDDRVQHHVLFMGDGPLGEQVRDAARFDQRIHYRRPVPPAEIIAYAKGADAGICLYEDTCLNHRYCLPNKLFESLLSGLPVLASDLPDQAAIVREHDAGWVVPNEVAHIADELARISANEGRGKRDGLTSRVADLSWDSEARVLLAAYRKVLGYGEAAS